MTKVPDHCPHDPRRPGGRIRRRICRAARRDGRSRPPFGRDRRHGRAGGGASGEFDALMARRGVRPTALQPFWDRAGFALGAVTALIGPEAAMACTAAVETEIDDHYSRQLDQLEASGEDPELAAMIEEFREDEREHRDAALAAGAERAPAYPLLSGLIRIGCRAAIRLRARMTGTGPSSRWHQFTVAPCRMPSAPEDTMPKPLLASPALHWPCRRR